MTALRVMRSPRKIKWVPVGEESANRAGLTMEVLSPVEAVQGRIL